MISSVIFQAKMPMIQWFPLLKCGDLMYFFVIYDSKLIIFKYWTVGCIKQPILNSRLGVWEIMISNILWTKRLIMKIIGWLIDNKNNCYLHP